MYTQKSRTVRQSVYTKADAEQQEESQRNWVYSATQVKFFGLVCVLLILMHRSFCTVDFFFSYYTPKGVTSEDLSLAKLLIRCLAGLLIIPIGSFTFRNIKSDIFLILVQTLFFLVGSILFVTGILGAGRFTFVVGYFFVKVAFALFVSLALKYMVSYTNSWRYLGACKTSRRLDADS